MTTWTLILVTLFGIYRIDNFQTEDDCYRNGHLLVNMGFKADEGVDYMRCFKQLKLEK